MNQFMFHTQEDRGTVLTTPIMCDRTDAWFGAGYYFWADEEDAVNWGETAKRGVFKVYKARIESDRVLDTVFNREHYEFFILVLKTMAEEVQRQTGLPLSKVDVCEYLNDKAGWKEDVDVLLACDVPIGKREILPIPFRKRIQAAVYNINCVKDFQIR